MELGGDAWLADRIYQWGGYRWAVQDNWWASSLMHRGGKNLSAAAAFLVLLFLLYSHAKPNWRSMQKPLAYLLTSVALSPSLVSLLKRFTHLDCPWDLQRYGGSHPYVTFFQVRPVELAQSVCFPAGHASAGYAWIALYFFACHVAPKWRWPALSVALLAGLSFGITQQLRGAHFLSHDVAALWLCWVVAVVLHAWFFRQSSNAPFNDRIQGA